ncbi:MAG: CHAT domain-containing protein [Patiriisocius sp.]|jgi:CHAT domain-containing protein
MHKVIFFLVCIIICTPIEGQSFKLDSLINTGKEYSVVDSSNINLVQEIIDLSILEKMNSLRKSYFNLGYNYYSSKNNVEDLVRLLMQEDEATKLDSLNDDNYVTKINRRLGYWLNKNGHPLQSIEYYKKCYILNIESKSDQEKYVYYNYVLSPQSVNYAQLGDYDNAMNLLIRTIDFYKNLKILNSLATAYSNAGEYQFLQENFAKAKKYYLNLLEIPISQLNLENVLAANIGLGKIEESTGNISNAVTYWLKSLELINGAERSVQLILIEIELYTLLASNEIKTNSDITNRHYELKTIILAEKHYSSLIHRRLSHMYNTMGYAYLDSEINIERAENYFRKALKSLPKNISDVQSLAAYRGLLKIKLSNANDQKDILEETINLLDSTIMIYETIRPNYLNDLSRYRLAEYINLSIAEGLDFCYTQFKKTGDTHLLMKALNYVEISKAAALFDAISNSESIDLQNDKNLEFNEHLNVPEYHDVFKFISDKYDGLIHYKQVDTFLYIFTIYDGFIDCNRIDFSMDINSNNKQSKLWSDFSQSLKFQGRHSFNKDNAFQLYKLIWPKILNPAENVLIIPEGELATLPFDALVDDSGDFLVNKHVISYASSVRSIMKLSKEKGNDLNKKVLCIAPTFSWDSTLNLSKSLEEKRSIASSVKTDSLLNHDATRANFLRLANNYSVVHLSTHAELNSKENQSYIYFSDSTFNIDALYDLKFDNSLMVLSACETGLGEHNKSEGVLSLSRAFNYANVPSVVSSLWKINENSTSTLFKSFYREISEHSTSSSLTLAKRNYLLNDEISIEQKTPYYWAGIVHWGVDGNIVLEPIKEPFNWTKIISAATLLFGFLFFLYFKK